MKKLIIFTSVLFIGLLQTYVTAAEDTKILTLSTRVLNNKDLPFLSHKGSATTPASLAMNIKYEPIKLFKVQLDSSLKRKLKIFTGWNNDGEAHITIITPPEYEKNLKQYISIEKIEEIALQNDIQETKIEILGLGRGQATLNDTNEETYFVLVAAPNLFKIRKEIHKEFVRNGGTSENWDPSDFYPHITVGFTARDLYKSDGVIKDVKNSLDDRYKIIMRP